MAETKSSNIHVAMFPWVAFGHFTPYLHLANKLAEKGHIISYLVPKGTIPKLGQGNQFPDLIKFFPFVIPQVNGLPSGAETASDVPFQLQNHLCTALDQTKDQIKTILQTIKPNFVLYDDIAYWIPSLGKDLGFKSIVYSVICAAGQAMRVVPAKKIVKGMKFEDLMQPPPGYPSSTVVPRPDEIPQVKFLAEEFGSGIPFYDRLVTGKKESDAFAIRTCYEIEGPFIDYLSQQYSKPVFLTGPVLPEKPISQLDEKWENWLSKFEIRSVVYCAFGSQIILEKKQFQELLLGFELCGLPFLVALKPPEGCLTVEEALPEGFGERIQGRGWVYGGWVPQPQLLEHPSVGCFVSHCGFGSMWESLLSDCQIVLLPFLGDQIVNTMVMVEELKVAIEVKKDENGWISKESLSNAIKAVTNKESEVALVVKSNHAKWKKILADKNMQETYVDSFIKNLLDLLK